MQSNPCHDDASDVVDAFLTAMREVFDPASPCPPDGGGSTLVRFFAGDGDLPASLMPGPQSDCDPLLWVRVAHRFRSRDTDFPAAYVGDAACGHADIRRALAVEIGVGRYTTMEADPDWDTLATEAEISLDDSWRIEKALCAVAARLRSKTRAVATDTVAPFGPQGGVIAWTGMAYVQF
ncbi:hypothetical protein H7K45_27715 [Mycobacterium yunnanensis]|uniref:Uncharacterized protein n=1 Tax=Mycobacterium yunnanensis TaxID=368477 RepID=A0A9X3BWG9_9MYCO|nr:hypothetical protein [Mycobacterium yunnanensis]MCV7424340.1 hypothetical protein [Mycobacterium yunnanensis]